MTYSCAPAASARTIWLCSLSVVTIISVIALYFVSRRTAETHSPPFIPGLFRSLSARSGTASSSSNRSSASWPLPASTTSNPSCRAMRARISRIARESSITSARIASSLSCHADRRRAVSGSRRAQAVGGGASGDHAVEPVVDADGGLGGAEEQPAVGLQQRADALQHRALRRPG